MKFANRFALFLPFLIFTLFLFKGCTSCNRNPAAAEDCSTDERCYFERETNQYYSLNPENPCPCANDNSAAQYEDNNTHIAE
ncbi:MAG: hypothetical protein H6696_09825 [Deferribacteres bacterium]|nr:hypothetical protein [candidate division KSB1 bacterium]MCB9502226.1 hypothetical protein [Deferribacteres bacterium]